MCWLIRAPKAAGGRLSRAASGSERSELALDCRLPTASSLQLSQHTLRPDSPATPGTSSPTPPPAARRPDSARHLYRSAQRLPPDLSGPESGCGPRKAGIGGERPWRLGARSRSGRRLPAARPPDSGAQCHWPTAGGTGSQARPWSALGLRAKPSQCLGILVARRPGPRENTTQERASARARGQRWFARPASCVSRSGRRPTTVCLAAAFRRRRRGKRWAACNPGCGRSRRRHWTAGQASEDRPRSTGTPRPCRHGRHRA